MGTQTGPAPTPGFSPDVERTSAYRGTRRQLVRVSVPRASRHARRRSSSCLPSHYSSSGEIGGPFQRLVMGYF